MSASPTRLAAALTAGALTLTACGGTADDTSAGASTDLATAATTDAPAGPADTTVAPGDAGAVAPPVGTPLPADDAQMVRNDLLALAAFADFTSDSPGTAIVQSWLGTYPALRQTLIDDQPADATTVSASTAFLTTPIESDDDMAWGFAVQDRSGRCAGGVVVILGAGTGDAVGSYPSQFAPVDDLSECTAEAAVAALAAQV